MWTTLLGLIAALVPMLITAWIQSNREEKRFEEAIRKRDRDELRAGMDAVDKLQQ